MASFASDPTPSSPSLRGADPLVDVARLAAAGDLAATARLLRAVGPRLTGAVRAVLGPAHPDLDDAVQQSLIALVQALPAFRGECSPASYGARIAVRIAVATRRMGRLRALRRDEMASREPPPMPIATPGDDDTSERRRRLLRELLSEIPEEQAEAMALRVVLGWSLEEVSEATGAPTNTVRSRLRLAREALRKRIEADPRLADELEVSP